MPDLTVVVVVVVVVVVIVVVVVVVVVGVVIFVVDIVLVVEASCSIGLTCRFSFLMEVTWLNCEYITFLNQWPIVVLKRLSQY